MGLYDDDEDNVVTSAATTSSEAVVDADSGPTAPKRARSDANSEADSIAVGQLNPASDDNSDVRSKFARELLWSLGAKKGEREEMQDAHLAEDKILDPRPDIKRCALYGIFDGHAGARAATHCERHFASILRKKLAAVSDVASMENGLKRYFTETFKKLDEMFLAEARMHKPVWKDGTTATTVLILNDSLYAANIGDSRAVVARIRGDSSIIPIQMTVDHNPTQYGERMRIQKCGATVKDGRINGILEVSRSIGDGQFKGLGVVSTPDLKKCSLTPHDKFLLIACDGLWKAFSNEEAIQTVLELLAKAEKEETVITASCGPEQAAWNRVAEELAAEAVRRKCGDNVSVLLVRLEKCPE